MRWGSYTATLIVAASVITLAGCGGQTLVEEPPVAPAAAAPAEPAPAAPAQPAATTPAATPAAPQPDHFREATNRATSAVALGQSAQSPDDWKLAASRWQQALGLMQKVPSGHPNYARAQTKIKEYQQNLTAAQQRASGVPQATASSTPAKADDGLVAQIPIVERRGGTPVVPVTLTGQRGKQQFSMLFDTGATGTLITAEMAQALGVVIVGETVATIADGSQVTLPIGYVDVIEVGGLRKEGVLVAIGGDVGLLGQDIYGDYGIALGGNSINLYE
ncbi:MAG TPA: retropepsin-like aspartic protease [Trichocoleus sp.]